METIDIPAQTHPWSTVLEVARHFTADEWLLTGRWPGHTAQQPYSNSIPR